METILDKFERKTIEVRGINDKIEHEPAWCYRQIAVTNVKLDGEPHHAIVCIPNGCMFPLDLIGLYKHIEDACGAALELNQLANWATVEGFSSDMSGKVYEIAVRHNADHSGHTPDYAKIVDGSRMYLNDTAPPRKATN